MSNPASSEEPPPGVGEAPARADLVVVASCHDGAGAPIAGYGRWPLDLARALAAINRWQGVAAVSFGAPGTRGLGPAAELRLLAPHRRAVLDQAPFDASSWDLPGALGDSEVVVVCDPASRSGEAAALVAVALGKRLVLVERGVGTSRVALSLGLLSLATRVLCTAPSLVEQLPPEAGAVVVPPGVDHRALAPSPLGVERRGVLWLGSLPARPGALPAGVVQVTQSGTTAKARRDVTVERSPSEERLRDLYRGAVVTVSAWTPLAGGPPHAALESMACATPVVVVRGSPAADVVDDGVTGLVAGSPTELGDVAARLVSDPLRAAEMGRAARRAVDERFEMEDTAQAVAAHCDAVRATSP